jgi:hypothetical protein
MNNPLLAEHNAVNVGYARSDSLNQGAMIDVKPLPEEDANLLMQFKLQRRGTFFFIIFAFLLILFGVVYPKVAKTPSTDAALANQTKSMNAFIGVGVTILLCAILFYVRLFHTDEVIITETRYVRKVGTQCDLRWVNFRFSSNQKQYNMDYLTGVELRTDTNNSPLIIGVLLAFFSISLTFVMSNDQDLTPTVITIVLVLSVLCFPAYIFSALKGRQAFVRLSFSSGLQSHSTDGPFFEMLIANLKRIWYRYPIYEDSISLPLDEGGRLYQTLSSLRLRAAARLAKI